MILQQNATDRTGALRLLTWLMVLVVTTTLNAAEFSAVDFGARPDDGRDDTQAVKKAIHSCQTPSAKRLVFPKGRYDFYPGFATELYFFISNTDEALKRVAFPLVEIKAFVIEGQDSEFLFHGFINPFILDRSSNITLKNVSIDFVRPFHSEAIILGHDAEGMDGEIREGFPFTVHRGTLLFTDGKDAEAPLGPLPAREQVLILKVGDTLILTHDQVVGRPAQLDLDAKVIAPAQIGCTLPAIFADVRAIAAMRAVRAMATSAPIFSLVNCVLACNWASLPCSWRIFPHALRRSSGTDISMPASSSNGDLSRNELVGCWNSLGGERGEFLGRRFGREWLGRSPD
jgi:hypothetical protein